MKRYLTTFTLILFAAGLMSISGKAPVHPVGKDISVLADALLEIESKNPTTIDEMKTFVSQVETMAEPYFQGKKKSVSKSEKTLRVLDEVAKYADEVKQNGSTFDMVESGRLHTLIYHYKTSLNIGKMCEKADQKLVTAVNDEAEAWLKLENTLNNYYACSAYIFNEGASMSHIEASGKAWSLAELRYNDTEKILNEGLVPEAWNVAVKEELKKGSNNVVYELRKAAINLIGGRSGDFNDNKYLSEVTKDLNETCNTLDADMQSWIKARTALVAHSKDRMNGAMQTMSLFVQMKKIAKQEQ